VTLTTQYDYDGKTYPPGEYVPDALPAPVCRAVKAELRDARIEAEVMARRASPTYAAEQEAARREQEEGAARLRQEQADSEALWAERKYRRERLTQKRFWCDCLRLCRPLYHREVPPDHICPENYAIICAAWAVDRQQAMHAGPGHAPDTFTDTVAGQGVRVLNPYAYPFGLVNGQWWQGGMDSNKAGFVKLIVRQWVEVPDDNGGLKKRLFALPQVRTAIEQHRENRKSIAAQCGPGNFAYRTAGGLKEYIARLPELGVPQTPGTAAFLLYEIEGLRVCNDFGFFLPCDSPTFGKMVTSLLIDRASEEGAGHGKAQPGEHALHLYDIGGASDWNPANFRPEASRTIEKHRAWLLSDAVHAPLAKHDGRKSNPGPPRTPDGINEDIEAGFSGAEVLSRGITRLHMRTRQANGKPAEPNEIKQERDKINKRLARRK